MSKFILFLQVMGYISAAGYEHILNSLLPYKYSSVRRTLYHY